MRARCLPSCQQETHQYVSEGHTLYHGKHKELRCFMRIRNLQSETFISKRGLDDFTVFFADAFSAAGCIPAVFYRLFNFINDGFCLILFEQKAD